ncbi:MAG: TatD family hydrolase [Defluviitaleaceae bacterium]|nr:TatD family hydrolase [Defluviitaleaceae bacterium]MCL2264173.1 TatD family hydrolase [Defluviitaleaceae bacterium]
MIIDTHAHYDNERFKADRHELLKALPENGVEKIINIGCDLKTSKASVKLAEKYDYVFATVGVHPHYVKGLADEIVKELTAMCENKKVVGFGEIGLDFFHNHSPQGTQRMWFKRLLKLTAELNLPAIIHSRDANDDVFEMISASTVRRGVVHAFSGDAALATAYVEMGFHIGIGGVVTFKKTDILKEAVAAVPLDKILLETDCPYLSPEPHRGTRNESPNISHIAKVVAEIKNETPENICNQTAQNAQQLFGI